MQKIFTKAVILWFALCSCFCLFFVTGCDISVLYEEIIHTIYFETDVEGLKVPSITAPIGSSVTAPTDPQRDGYRFDGWMLDDELYVFDKMPAKDITLTAVWTKVYTITFDTGIEGLTVAAISAEAGDAVTAPTIPQCVGYRFEGWMLDDELYVFDKMPEEDITLTALWTKVYTITFDTGVEELTIEFTAEAGSKIIAPTDLWRDGYRFDGWMLDGEPYIFDLVPEEDITLTAIWTKLFTVTFETGTDETIPSVLYAEGDIVQEPEAPSRAGCKFMGWLLDEERFEFGEMPGRDITLVANWAEFTNLPAMFIDLFDEVGNTVPLSGVSREAYVDSNISLTNTEEEYELDSLKASFKGRGNASWEEEKKCYKIKFDKKQSIFGREKNKHWVIIACVQFSDTTMSRNYLAYNMAREVFDGIEYTTPAYWIDVYVNGEYRGVYLLCEHVRVGEGRVDIESEYGMDDTGYLIEYDAHATGEEGVDYFRVDGLKYPFTIHSPDPEDGKYETEGGITKERYMQQIAFIKDYVTRVYQAALSGDYDTFSELADTDSFVDMYILHELFKNVDTGWSSFYLYKKPGGKLYAGPVWDFDGTTNGALGRGDRSPEGIYVAKEDSNGDNTESQLYIALYASEGFQIDLRARWKVLSPAISAFLEEKLNDEVYEANRAAMGKNFALWKGKSQADAENDWIADIKELKQWLLDRILWLDNEWN